MLKKKLLADIPSLTIVTVSEWLANMMKQSHLKNRSIEVIHNGIDIKTFSPQALSTRERYGIDKQKKIVLGVASPWSERKGLKDYVNPSLIPDNYFQQFLGVFVGLTVCFSAIAS